MTGKNTMPSCSVGEQTVNLKVNTKMCDNQPVKKTQISVTINL